MDRPRGALIPASGFKQSGVPASKAQIVAEGAVGAIPRFTLWLQAKWSWCIVLRVASYKAQAPVQTSDNICIDLSKLRQDPNRMLLEFIIYIRWIRSIIPLPVVSGSKHLTL